MRRLGTAATWAALALVLAFLVVPVVAVFAAAGPATLIGALGRPAVTDALMVSLVTNAVAQAVVLGLGTPAAYVIARGVRGRALLVTLVELPLVLPPAVAGLGLVFTFGSQGLLGPLDLDVTLTQAAVVLAVAYVSSPFYIRAAIAAFESVDANVVDAARTLGARPSRVFVRVIVPMAAGGLGAGATLALARGLGEFGATILFAGSLRGSTQTLPLAVYDELNDDQTAALAIGGVLIVASLVILVASKAVPAWRR